MVKDFIDSIIEHKAQVTLVNIKAAKTCLYQIRLQWEEVKDPIAAGFIRERLDVIDRSLGMIDEVASTILVEIAQRESDKNGK